MNKTQSKTVFLAIALAMGIAGVASAHPSDGYAPQDLPPGYGTDRFGEPVDWSFGDIQFVCPFPDPSTLSDTEKYMLAGTKNSWQADAGLDAWWHEMATYASICDSRLGHIPDVLSEDIVKQLAWDAGSVDEATMALLSNPITGQAARLTQAEFSPGDLYIRKLSDNELAQACERNDILRDCINGVRKHPVTGEVTQRIQMTSPVYYVRMYGRSNIIMTRLYFTFKVN